MTLDDLHLDRAALAQLCERYHVAHLEVFGSFARGDARPESDLDVLVTFAPGVFWGIEYLEFVAELESLIGRRVDCLERPLVEADARRPIFRSEVLGHARPLYAVHAA